jgi:hypothetical protein
MQSYSGKILARLIQRTQTLMPEEVSALVKKNLEGFQQQLDSGKEMTEGGLSQDDSVLKTLLDGRSTLQKIQDKVTPLLQPFYRNSDPADDPPSLPDGTKERQYPLPAGLLISNYPQVQKADNASGVTGGTSRGGIIPSERLASPSTTTTPNSTSSIHFNTSSAHGNLTRSDTSHIPSISTSIVAPSADLQPMTSSTVLSQPAGTDWKTLFREMK